jgi:hypothetical protein
VSSASPSPTKGGRVSSISSHSSPAASIDFPSRRPDQSYRPLPLPHRLLASSVVCSMVARPRYPLPTAATSATDLVGVALLPLAPFPPPLKHISITARGAMATLLGHHAWPINTHVSLNDYWYSLPWCGTAGTAMTASYIYVFTSMCCLTSADKAAKHALLLACHCCYCWADLE